MKRHLFLPGILLLMTSLFSFKPNRGGDVFEIYLNGQRIHQQFVHMDNSAKTLHLAPFNETDKIEVFYSHCGLSGKNRVLILKNEKNVVVQELKYPDSKSNRSLMAFYRKDISKNKNGNLKLFYAAKELPQGKLLAILNWSENKARTASL